MSNAGLYATKGAKLYIGQALASKTSDFVLGDFSGESWVQISWVENMGKFGDDSALIKFDAIDAGRTQKQKGINDAGDMAIVCGIDYLDDGQAALRAAQQSTHSYAFKVEFNDMPSGGSNNSQRYFIALVMGASEQLDTANNIMKLASSLAINSNIVQVAAS